MLGFEKKNKEKSPREGIRIRDLLKSHILESYRNNKLEAIVYTRGAYADSCILLQSVSFNHADLESPVFLVSSNFIGTSFCLFFLGIS